VALGLVKSGNDRVCARDEYPTVAQKKTGRSRAILHRTKPFYGRSLRLLETDVPIRTEKPSPPVLFCAVCSHSKEFDRPGLRTKENLDIVRV
jgi:hypothetical protein